ncbi:hypothetical protein EIP86_001395 [Pleurotus ostreatoroseus]|nr:hypothetical protein EIP86_001395 [Pleurotus ostreatoroseus]
MAFDFGPFGILAFVSLDLLFTPNWATSFEALPYQLPDVYTDYWSFLEAVANWIKARHKAKSSRSGLATTEIRGANRVFAGIGVYTVLELFFLAGLSVFLTEYEFFTSPSRIARFCEAYWAFAHEAHTELEMFLQPYYHGYILAATKEQRLRFSYWLHVYGKKEIPVSERMHRLCMDYVDSLNDFAKTPNVTRLRDGVHTPLFDVFEPTFIQAALTKNQLTQPPELEQKESESESESASQESEESESESDSISQVASTENGTSAEDDASATEERALRLRLELRHKDMAISRAKGNKIVLGEWIFGTETWIALGGTPCPKDDPLSLAFEELGIHEGPTHLHPTIYAEDTNGLFLTSKELLAKRRLKPQLWNGEQASQKKLWSITPNFPENVVSPIKIIRKRGLPYANPSFDKLFQIIDIEPHTLAYIINNTQLAAIGPLEYCAVARIIAGNSSKLSISVCLESPLLSAALVHRQKASKARIAQGRHKPGKRKEAAKKSAGRGGWNKAAVPRNGDKKREANDQGSNGGGPFKKARLSIDAHLVQLQTSVSPRRTRGVKASSS